MLCAAPTPSVATGIALNEADMDTLIYFFYGALCAISGELARDPDGCYHLVSDAGMDAFEGAADEIEWTESMSKGGPALF